MKKTTYDFDELVAKLRKFYESSAPIPPRCSKAKKDQIVFQHNVRKLSDEDLFLITYVEEENINSLCYKELRKWHFIIFTRLVA
ncbi:MAG: hypothetical protein LBG93_07780 [Treponema sp.]|jgi:hypothetical protein|nr:hypothetical protein [Treponema sp.]